MVAELSALQQTIGALTGMNGLPVIIVQCVVTTIYTCESWSKAWHVWILSNSSQHLVVSKCLLSQTIFKVLWSLV